MLGALYKKSNGRSKLPSSDEEGEAPRRASPKGRSLNKGARVVLINE